MNWPFLLIAFCSASFAAESTPTARLNQSLAFADDLQFENLELAINRQLAAYERSPLAGKILFGGRSYPKTILKDSLILFKQLALEAKDCLKSSTPATCLANFNAQINKKFTIYVPIPSKGAFGFRQKAATKFTSYYSPDLSGSRVPTERFKRPIYRMPDNPKEQNYTRVAIDYRGALSGKGYEIFWVEDSFFDLYLLHVQGGGRIKIHNEDGTEEVKYLSYQGKNARPFQMIYKYLLQMNYLQDASIENQRKFLEVHPEKEEEVFASCPSYVYFKESAEEPVGLDSIPLTEGRSLAMDSRIYKTTGIINFVKTLRPSGLDANGKVVKSPYSRFYIAQDTGGAIRGAARCDLYAGYGPHAEFVAYNTNDQGEQYFLIKK
ncbi:MAG: MltA domain-containing protein [Bacteriovoracaceae bacterium]